MHNKNNLHFILAKMAEAYPIGKVNIAPGSLASLIALFIGYFILLKLGITLYVIFILAFIIFGFFLCEAHIKIYNKKDPSEVVIDEFGGQFIALLATIDTNNIYYITLSLFLSFVLFRFFDITKIGLIKKSEKLKGGYGIMADDILAGIFAFITQSAILTYFNQSLIIKSYIG